MSIRRDLDAIGKARPNIVYQRQGVFPVTSATK